MAGPRKINKGTRLSGIPADSWNGFVDTHRIVSQMRPPTNGAAQIAADDRAIVVTLQNDSEGDVPRGGVLKLGAPIVEPSTRAAVVLEGILFGGDTPEADNNEQQIGIALAPVADGEVGPFAVVGVVWAKLNITDAAHAFAKPKASTAELESDASTGFPVIWKESGTGSKWAVVSLQKDAPGNVIYAQVVGAVTSGDPTFTFDNAVAVVGSIPSGGTGTAQNQYAQTYSDNDWVFLFQEKSSDQWLTERGGTSGSQVVYFELTENKSYGDASKLAKPVLPDGTMDSGADAFHVVDDKNQFYGRAAEGGADGYRGFGLRQWDDYSEGVPGFRIITMEGPALELIATLDEDLASPTDCTLAEDPAVFGLAQRGRIPAPVSMVDVQVYDDIGVAAGAKSGEKWIVRWNEADERYCFWRKVEGPRYITIKGTTGAVARTDGTFTLSEPVSVNGPVPDGTITVTNDPPINTPGGRTVYARYNVSIGTDDTDRWDTGDGGNFLHHLRGIASWSESELQSLGHDNSDDPEWQDDTSECPE